MKAKQSRAKTRAPRGRAKAGPNKRAAKPKTTRRDRLDDFIDAAARALDLPVRPSWRPAIRVNLQVTLRQAALFADFPLPDDAEPAPLFQA